MSQSDTLSEYSESGISSLILERGKSTGRFNNSIFEKDTVKKQSDGSVANESSKSQISRWIDNVKRKHLLKKLYQSVVQSTQFNSGIDMDKLKQDIKKLEIVIANYVIQDNLNTQDVDLINELYIAKIRNISQVLALNPELLLNYSDKLTDLVTASPHELVPLKWDDFLKRKEAETGELVNGLTQVSESTLYTCGRCKKNRTTYSEMQTRSADEGMTLKIRCLNCGKRWNIFN